MTAVRIPVLLYHSHNVGGSTYEGNDQVALGADLELIAELGLRVISLRQVVGWLRGEYEDSAVCNAVALSCDDGPISDFAKWEFAGVGTQPGFFSILQNFARQHGTHAVTMASFVIASPKARAEIAVNDFDDPHFLTHQWWLGAQQSGLISIENHGWDHSHPALDRVIQRRQLRNSFVPVATFDECDCHVNHAAGEIARHLGGLRPELFAFPFGDSSDYMREQFLPRHSPGTLAAFSAHDDYVTLASNRWNLPRFVSGRDWRTPKQLRKILKSVR